MENFVRVRNIRRVAPLLDTSLDRVHGRLYSLVEHWLRKLLSCLIYLMAL